MKPRGNIQAEQYTYTVYPSLANGIQLTANAALWVEGPLVEVLPVNHFAKPFRLETIVVESASSDDVYELSLFSGGREFTRLRFVKLKTQVKTEFYVNSVELLPDQAITAKLASGSLVADTLKISAIYTGERNPFPRPSPVEVVEIIEEP